MITVTDCEFAQLEFGEVFLHHGITYRKVSHNSATLFDADAHDAIHRFNPGDQVTVVDEDFPNTTEAVAVLLELAGRCSDVPARGA